MNMLRENMRLIAECSQQLVRLGENLWGKEQKLDKVEPLDIPTMTTDFIKEHGLPCPEGYFFKDENGNVINATKIVMTKKKQKYPETYEECTHLTGYSATCNFRGYRPNLIVAFQKLLICRDAYWKIAGDWKPDWNGKNSAIYNDCNGIVRGLVTFVSVLCFPTTEMRDAFYENFKKLIEECKELL